MEQVCDLYHAGFAQYILPSGGKNAALPTYDSEWAYFRDIACQRGVPDTCILKEDMATNTFENARFSRAVLQHRSLPLTRAILVCKAFHARRALLTYQLLFNNQIEYMVSPVIDARNIRRDNWFHDKEKIIKVMSEVEKIGKYFAPHLHRGTNERVAEG